MSVCLWAFERFIVPVSLSFFLCKCVYHTLSLTVMSSSPTAKIPADTPPSTNCHRIVNFINTIITIVAAVVIIAIIPSQEQAR